MYVLNRNAFRSVDTNCVVPFVECWERYYGADDHDREYFAELNIGNDLTEQNVVQLLRWKDPRMLTHPRKADGEPNPRVTRVLEQMSSLNRFRHGDLTTDKFQAITHNIFPNGIIWQLFLFHLARPADWPIADQHVFRSYSVLFNAAVPDSIATFASYSKTFQELAARLRRGLGIDDDDQALVVRTNKRLDNALFAFGQFLATYDR
jgi:hypothetical protein